MRRTGRKMNVMKDGNVAVNLSVDKKVAEEIDKFIAGNKRKGRRNRSELTESLWIAYLRSKGVKSPALLKTA